MSVESSRVQKINWFFVLSWLVLTNKKLVFNHSNCSSSAPTYWCFIFSFVNRHLLFSVLKQIESFFSTSTFFRKKTWARKIKISMERKNINFQFCPQSKNEHYWQFSFKVSVFLHTPKEYKIGTYFDPLKLILSSY